MFVVRLSTVVALGLAGCGAGETSTPREVASGDPQHDAAVGGGDDVRDGGSEAVDGASREPSTRDDAGGLQGRDGAVVESACGSRALEYAISHHSTQMAPLGRGDACWEVGANVAAGDVLSYATCRDTLYFDLQPVFDVADCAFALRAPDAPGLCVAVEAVTGTLAFADCDVGDEAQRWDLQRESDGVFSLQSKTGLCPAAPAADLSLPQSVRMMPCGTERTSFHLEGLTDAMLHPPPTTLPAGDPVTLLAGSALFDFSRFAPARTGGASQTADGWLFHQPGAYLEYEVDAPASGLYLVSITKSSWLRGAYLEVAVDGQVRATSHMSPDPEIGDLSTAEVVGIELAAGRHVLRLQAPGADQEEAGNPFLINIFYVTGVGAELPDLGRVTEVASEGDTQIDIRRISDLYRFTLTPREGGALVWSGPHNRAFLDYRLHVSQAGTYELSVEYACPSGSDGLDVAYDVERVRTFLPDELIASVDLAAGPVPGEFLESSPMQLPLREGLTTVRLSARFTQGLGVQGFSVAGIRLRRR